MDEESKRKVALFRFSLITALLNQTFCESSAKAYIASVSAKVYDVPVFGKKEYAPATIKGWLLDYRKHGIEGLYPLTHSDKGKPRALSVELRQYILDAKDYSPSRSAKSIFMAMALLLGFKEKQPTLTPDIFLKANDEDTLL